MYVCQPSKGYDEQIKRKPPNTGHTNSSYPFLPETPYI